MEVVARPPSGRSERRKALTGGPNKVNAEVGHESRLRPGDVARPPMLDEAKVGSEAG
jgi:hypothetical protein